MRRNVSLNFFAFVVPLLIMVLIGCTKSDYLSTAIKSINYYPVTSGQVWIYRLDSTVVSPFGSELNVVSYHLKDSVGTSFTDNAGRESWIIYRSITDTLEESSWQNISSYYVTPTANDVEVVDDANLRFIKLVTPVTPGFSWSGNTYIDTRSATSPYQYLDGWTYTYTTVDSPYATLAGVIDSTVTVLQADETSPAGPFDPNNYQQRNYSVEVYAKNIGLIYKNFLHWTWQPTPEPARYTDDSYGIILNLIRYK